MPVFDSRTVIELARGIRAFVMLEAGLTRGEIPARDQDVSEQPDSDAGELARVRMRLEEKEREIAGLKQRLAAPAPMAGGGSPGNIVWVVCSNRRGSPWPRSGGGAGEGPA